MRPRHSSCGRRGATRWERIGSVSLKMQIRLNKAAKTGPSKNLKLDNWLFTRSDVRQNVVQL